MIQEPLWCPKEGTVGHWAEAPPNMAHLIVFFSLVVWDLLGASVHGIEARNLDRLDDMFHPKAALEGSFGRAYVALVVQVLATARRTYEMPHRTLEYGRLEGLKADGAVKRIHLHGDSQPLAALVLRFTIHRQQNSKVPALASLVCTASITRSEPIDQRTVTTPFS